MFKKNLWVVGLIAALAIMFSGCVPPVGGDDSGEEIEVVNLQKIIAGEADGLLDTAAWGALFDSTPFQKCGSPNFTIITEGGVQKLKIDGMVNGWGEGLDLTMAKAGFKSGDVLYIKGRVDSGKNGLMVNGKGGAYYRVGEWNSNDDNGGDGTFEKTFTLTGDDLTAIKTGSPQVIRLHYGPSDGDARKGTIIFEQITLNGIRGGGAVCDCVVSGCDCSMEKDCGPQCADCTPDRFEATGSASDYKIPAPAGLPANEFYLNLASFTTDAIVPDGVDTAKGVKTVAYIKEDLDKKIASAVKFYYDAVDQRVNFILTTAQQALVQKAVDEGEPLKVEINGTAFPDVQVRYGFIKTNTGGNYNGTALVPDSNFSKASSGTLTTTNNKDGTTHFTLQIRQGPWLGAIVELKSIKIILPVVQTVNITDLDIAVPAVGETLQKKLSTSQFDGEIAWSPNDNNVKANTPYEATVTLTAKNAFWTFDGFTDTFKVGGLTPSDQTVTAANKVTVIFEFPGTPANTFPITGTVSDASVRPQTYNTATPPALVDLTGARIMLGTQLTATYTRAVNASTESPPGPDYEIGPIGSSLIYRWQLKSGAQFETQGIGKTFTPTKTGFYRIIASTAQYEPIVSAEFEAFSPASNGELDAALNAQFVRTQGATKIFSFAEWVLKPEVIAMADDFSGNTPFVVGGRPPANIQLVAKGLNVANVPNPWDGVLLVLLGPKWSHAGLNDAQYGMDLSGTKKYQITFYGVVIGAPPEGTFARIQRNGNAGGDGQYTIFGKTDELKKESDDPEVTFKIVSEPITGAQIGTVDALRIGVEAKDNVVPPFRITLLEVEELP